MIQHGAARIVNDKESMMNDDDIDDIIRRGEERTAQLNEKYSSLNIHDLANFTSEGGSAQNWEGEEFGKRKQIGTLWIEPSKRERKTNYSIDNYYSKQMRPGDTRIGVPRPARSQAYTGRKADHQFFPARFQELQQRHEAYKKVSCPYSSSPAADVDRLCLQQQENFIVPPLVNPAKTAEELEAERAAVQQAITDGLLLFCKLLALR